MGYMPSDCNAFSSSKGKDLAERDLWRKAADEFQERAALSARSVVVVLSGFSNWDDAPVSDFTLDVFELDRRVVDLEIVMKNFLDIAQNPFAHRWWDISDGDVAGERAALGTNAPHMQVVDVVDAFDFANRRFQMVQLESAGSAF